MRDANGLQYFLTDHLGSTVAVTNASGTLTSQQRYLPFGQVRTDVDTINETDLGYTGQRDLGMGGLMDYKARFYSTLLGRFIQPDTIIPAPFNPQSWNRFSYVFNNPIKYNDPTGHYACGDGYEDECDPNPNGLSVVIYSPDDNPGENQDDDDAMSSLGDIFGGNDNVGLDVSAEPNSCVGYECLYNLHQDDGEITLPYVPPLGWIDSILANEWTPLITDLIQLGAIIGIGLLLVPGGAVITTGIALTVIGLFVVSQVAMMIGMASTAYQASHGLNGVTTDDLVESGMLNLLGPHLGAGAEVLKSAPKVPTAVKAVSNFFGDFGVPIYDVISDIWDLSSN
jgi:RHS repeat-associated protein